MRRLNLGAGTDIRPKEEGWCNVDVRHLPGVDVQFDLADFDVEAVKEGLGWAGDFDEALAQDLIEHLSPASVPDFLKGCFEALKPGGVLRLRYPDLYKIFRRAVSGALKPEEAVQLVYGDQGEEAGGDWGAHRWGYTDMAMAALLKEAGFVDIVIEGHPTEHNRYAEAKKP